MNVKKSIVELANEKRCPVCGKVSYSRFGTHPQCAVVQADEKTRVRLKKRKPA